EPCEQSNPCSLGQALGGGAKEGDEVIVLDGATPYSQSGALTPSVALNIHGQTGQPIPEIDYTAKSASPMLTPASGSSVSRLRLVGEETEQTLVQAYGATVIDDLLLEARAAKETLVSVISATLRDSVLSSATGVAEVTGIASGPSIGIGSSSTMRNDTVELPGAGSIAMMASGSCFPAFPTGCEPILSSSSSFDVTNTILRGGMWDLKTTGSEGYYGQIALSHSNYRQAKVEAVPGTVTDGGGNQTSSEPSLTADFHEQAGSVTIDAGVADPLLGAQDPDGHARALGAAPDIGAYEFVPPAPPPPPPPPAPSPPPPPAQASVAGAKAKGAAVTETLGCQGKPGQTCKLQIVLTSTEHMLGSRLLSVTARSKKHGHPRTVRVTVGSLIETLQAGQVATVSVPLNSLGKRLLTSRHALPATATTSLLDATGTATTLAKSKLTLIARHKRHRGK
ncbi:MAG TPA: choice-of-anchor Q domain-containing protein, partial [Solirubrobacteraceae bacterium]